MARGLAGQVRQIHRGTVKALLGAFRSEGFSKDTVRLTRATLSIMRGDAVEDHDHTIAVTRCGRICFKRPAT